MVILALVLISGLMIGCTSTTTPTTTAPATTPVSEGKTWNLKYSFEQSLTAPYSYDGHIPYGKAIEEATNGKVKVTLYDSSSLMKSTQIWEGVKAGTTDMGWLFTGLYPGQFSVAETNTLPFMFPNAEVGGRVSWALFEKYPEIQAKFKDVKVLTAWTTEPYFMISRSKFYKTMDDFKGEKIRAPGGPPTDFIKAMGGSPLSIAMPDCYLNLQKGVFDAMLVPAEAYTGWKLYEVAPYATYMATVAMNHSVIMNLNTWNSFPKEVQDQIMSVSGEKAAVQFSGGTFDKAREEQGDIIAKAGYTIQEYTVPDEEIQKWIEIAGQPIWDAWVKAQTAAGVTNAQQILDDTIALSKQYAAEPSMREK
jgi:TRAP-type C4-dicarboxylate transport system substrate-binding protein